MNEEQERQMFQEYEKQMNEANLNLTKANAQSMYERMGTDPVENDSIVKHQLDVSNILRDLGYLLKGYTLEEGENGEEVWTNNNDEDLKILSDYGVHLFKTTLAFYLNKNTLLSNFNEEEIARKMHKLIYALTDDIRVEPYKIFCEPSEERCQEELLTRLRKKAEMKAFSLQLQGKEVNIKEIEKGLIAEMDDRIEKEIEQIKRQLIKNKVKRFEVLITQIDHIVHSTYNRALKGSERTSLRRNVHVSESIGSTIQQPKGGSNIPIFSWFQGKPKGY